MKNKRIKHVLLSILFLLQLSFFISCDKDSGPYIKIIKNLNDTLDLDTIPEPTVYPYSIKFGADIKPIFTGNCVRACHNPSHPKLDLRPPVVYKQLLTDGKSAPYVNIVTPKQSLLYLHLTGIYTLMPKDGPKLSQGKIDSVFTWISQGAIDN